MVKRDIPAPRNILMSYHYFKNFDLDSLPNLTIIGDHGCMSLRGVRDECSDTLTYNDTGEPTASDRAAFWAAHNKIGG